MIAKSLQSPTCAEMLLDGRRVINFAGSAYLGIARDPALLTAASEALQQYGARVHIPLEYGVLTPPQAEVERVAADFFGAPAAIYLASGYFVGLAVLTGLHARFDVVLLDESAHYNLVDGAAASGAMIRRFAHLDSGSLEAELVRARREGRRTMIAIDAVCPMFGALPRLDIYARLAQEYGALLFVDESHSFGTLGVHGRGLAEEYGLSNAGILRGGSLGKAFCAAGAVIVGATEDIAAIRAAPCERGSSWGLVPGAAMAAASLKLVQRRPQLLERLRANALRLKNGLRQLGVQLVDSPAPIATFVSGPASAMASLQQRLLAEDLFVFHARYVGAGSDGAIRCSVFADHGDAHIDKLLDALKRAL